MKSAVESFAWRSHLGAVVGDIARDVPEQGRVSVLAVIDLDVVAAGGAVELAVAAEADVAALDVHLRSGPRPVSEPHPRRAERFLDT